MKDFLKNLFSNSEDISYGRIASAVSLFFLIFWTCILIPNSNSIPEIPSNWLWIVCLPFGITKMSDIATILRNGSININKEPSNTNDIKK